MTYKLPKRETVATATELTRGYIPISYIIADDDRELYVLRDGIIYPTSKQYHVEARSKIIGIKFERTPHGIAAILTLTHDQFEWLIDNVKKFVNYEPRNPRSVSTLGVPVADIYKVSREDLWEARKPNTETYTYKGPDTYPLIRYNWDV